MDLIQAKDVAKITGMNNIVGKNAAKVFMTIFKLGKINDIYSRHHEKPASQFIDSILAEVPIKYHFSEKDTARIPLSGPFIIVANHPFGGMEGIILLNKILPIRPDIKIIGTFLFNHVAPVREYVFAVNPFETKRNLYTGMLSLRQAYSHVKNGHPLAVFPAGEVSTWYKQSKHIADRTWNQSIIRFIKNAGVPIVPLYFHGENSLLFHLMGKVHPLLRTASIPSELLKKQNEIIRVRIGNPITVKEFQNFSDPNEFGNWLRARTYLLEAGFPSQKAKLNSLKRSKQDVAPAISKNILLKELANIPKEYLLFDFHQYSIYCVPTVEIPNLVLEIGRLRELTFRAIGEGTDKSIDVDAYDRYYQQLFIWDRENELIVGGYRIGKGKELLSSNGLRGFYINTLFKMNQKMKPILAESLELGRSFITHDYQRKPLSLFLLWKGILSFILKNKGYRYLIGPVSISNTYTDLSKKVIVDWVERNFMAENLKGKILPRSPYKSMDTRTDTHILVNNIKNANELDQLISEIEPSGSKMPVLLKKYLSIGGKVACFNVDPLFNNCLDALLILDFADLPDNILKSLSKDLSLQSDSIKTDY